MPGHKYKSSRSLNKRDVAVNVSTDTPVLFESGNALIAWQAHPVIALVNIGFGAFVGVVRALTEIHKQRPMKSVSDFALKDIFTKFVGNLGASLEASGIILVLSAMAAAVLAAVSETTPLLPAAILGAFGAANLARGIAMRFDVNSILRRLLDVIGIALAALGCVLTAPASPLAVKLAFCLAAILEALKSLRVHIPFIGQLPAGLADLSFALALLANAVFSPMNALNRVANVIFAGAFMSLAALKTRGGVAEWIFPLRPKPIAVQETNEIAD